MTQPDHPAHLRLSRRHCDAVCKEIGERLSLALGPLSSELSPALLALIDELAKKRIRQRQSTFSPDETNEGFFQRIVPTGHHRVDDDRDEKCNRNTSASAEFRAGSIRR
jgi:hypothetical protein